MYIEPMLCEVQAGLTVLFTCIEVQLNLTTNQNVILPFKWITWPLGNLETHA